MKNAPIGFCYCKDVSTRNSKYALTLRVVYGKKLNQVDTSKKNSKK